MGLSSRFASVALGTGIALAIASQSAPASAYSIKRAKTGDVVAWKPTSVTFELDPSVADVTPGSADAVQAAAGGWSGHADAPEIRLVLTPGASDPSYDKHNTIVFKPSGYAPAGRALAITVLTYDDASGRILDADIVVNGAYTFSLPDGHHDPSLAARSVDTEAVAEEGEEVAENVHRTFDFQHVMAHELGHALGLSDEVRLEDALMYRYSAPNMRLRRAPHADDIDGLEQLYGTAPTSVGAGGGGCGGATISPRNPTQQASTFAFAFGLGLVAFMLLRARRGQAAGRVALVVGASAFVLASLPSVTKSARGEDAHGQGTATLGHATARVLTAQTTTESGLLRTRMELAVSSCRVAVCPSRGEAAVWGGRSGNVVQIVGGHPVPSTGDEVEVDLPRATPGSPALRPLPVEARRAAMRVLAIR